MPYFIHRTPQNISIDQSPEAPDSIWHLGPLDSKIDARDLACIIAEYYNIQPTDKPTTPHMVALEIYARLNCILPDDKRSLDAEIIARTGCSQPTARNALNRVVKPSPGSWGGHRKNAGRKPNG